MTSKRKTLLSLESNDPDGFLDWAEDLYEEEDLTENLEDEESHLDMIGDWLQERCGVGVLENGLVEFDTIFDDDECDVRAVIGSNPVAVYHHTSSGALKGIKEQGRMLPAVRLGFDPTDINSGAYVFVTTRVSGPEIEGYLWRAKQRFGGDLVTLTIRSNLYELEPDPDDADISCGRTQFVLPYVELSDIVAVWPERYAQKLRRSNPKKRKS